MVLFTDYSINVVAKYFNHKYSATIQNIRDAEELRDVLKDFGSVQIWASNFNYLVDMARDLGKTASRSVDKISVNDTIVSFTSRECVTLIKLNKVLEYNNTGIKNQN